MDYTLTPCECEHRSHFFGKNEARVNSPNGNPNHKYGHNFCAHFVVAVKTSMGVFKVCKDCAEDCYQHYQRVS